MTKKSPIVVLVRRVLAKPGKPSADAILGRCEGAALAHAIDLGARLACPVIAVAAGPAKRDDHALAIALRAGCDRAIRVHDRGVEDLDYLGIAEVLALTARKLGAQLVLCGDRSEEALAGATGPAVAERLDWPHLAGVVTITADGGTLLVTRRGLVQTDEFAVTTPAVLCIVRPPSAARAQAERADAHDDAEGDDDDAVSSAPGKARSQHISPAIKEIEAWTLANLDLDPRTLLPRSRFESKPRPIRRTPGVMLETPEALVARLKLDRVID